MKIAYVTSFSPDGYELYGKKFLDTYLEFIDHPLFCYVEAPCSYGGDQISYYDLNNVHGLNEFLENARFSAMSGHVWDNHYDYRFAATRFCRKHFAQIDAEKRAREQGFDWLVWLDADIEVGKPLPLPSGNNFLHYLGRPEWHSCASYVAWNLGHAQNNEWWKLLSTLYKTGALFALPEWHDSYVNDWIRHQLKIDALNIAEPYKDQLKSHANVFDYVFQGSRHKKGGLKYENNN